MEEKKFNNAIEKAENIEADNKSSGAAETKKTVSKGKASGRKSAVNAKKRATSTQKNSDDIKNSKKKISERQEREEANAKARIARAERREKRKEQRRKDALAKKQARIRKRENLKELKIKKREERLARRDELRHESKEARRERILQQRENLQKERAEKRQLKASLRKEKMQAKRERRQLRNQERREKRNQRHSRGLGGWLAAVITLGCTTLVLTTIIIWGSFMTGSGENMISGVYAKSFYDLVGYVDNIDVNLSKIAVTNDNESKQKMLVDLTVQANLAGEDLESLPLTDESRYSTVKFINQLADFSKYLNNKLIDGDLLSESDVNTLYEFKRINAELKRELNELATEIGDEFDFATLLNGESDNAFIERFNKLESNALDYPKMIYDGPFADKPSDLSNEKRSGESISEEQAVAVIEKVFSDYNLQDLALEGKAEGERFNVYNLVAKKGDEQFFAQVSEFGELALFDCYFNCESTKLSRDECITNAYEFLNKCGYKSIKAVWTTQSDNVCYINFVNFTDDVVIYADMIKVSVCMESGRVYSMDARAYLENNMEREIPNPVLRVEEAENKLDEQMQVLTSRLAYVPLESGKERLAYEFFCETAQGEEFYVYIDAINGKQVEIFKVILTNEGTLLL